MFDQHTLREAQNNNDAAQEANCANVDLIDDMVKEIQYLEKRLTGCESLYATLDKVTDAATREIRCILDYVEESAHDGTPLSVREFYTFSGMLNTLALLESISFEDFRQYARILGHKNDEVIKVWWMCPVTNFSTGRK